MTAMPRHPDYLPPDTSKNNTTYDTDLTDAQWILIAPFLPPPDTSGAPRTTNLRHAVNAMLYRLKTGCQWKMIPKDFGIPWKTVYNWHEHFARRGTWERVQRALAERVRVADGRDPNPSLLSLDSQTVKAAETAADTGFDPGKKLTGRKRHALVDSLGLVFAVAVTSAAVSDAAGAEVVLREVAGNRRLATVLADAAYNRATLDAYRTAAGAKYRLVIVSKLPGQKVFVPQPKRWLVERYFSWLRASRLLAREYEGRAAISRSNVYMRSAMLTIDMHLRQLANSTAASAA
jgi:putative transposase